MPGRILPVRETLEQLEALHGRFRFIPRFDPMEELVSCILSQHTADKNSFPAFSRMMQHYGTWEAVRDAPLAELTQVIRKAGLANQKAKAIQGSLRAIEAHFGALSLDGLRGKPMMEARSWLESLPGVGPKTASIVLCFAFGLGAIPVDTHVYRVAQRLGWVPAKMDERKAHDHLLKLVPPDLAFRFHTTLIQHGRKICKAPVPVCGACPVQGRCPWHRPIGPERARKDLRARRVA